MTGPGPPPPRDLAAVWRWCSDRIDATHEDLPPIGTPEWIAADLTTQGAAIAAYVLTTLDEQEPHMIAYRLAVELTADRRAMITRHRELKEVSRDICGTTDWARAARNHIPHDELERRRYPWLPDRARPGATGA